MKKIDKVRNMVRNEWVVLKKNLRKELNFFFSLSFKKYILNLFFPVNNNYIILFFRFILLYPIFKFFFDLIIFIFIIFFNFYFIIFDRIFELLKKLNDIFFLDSLFFKFNLKIIKFFRYIILFMFFVNIHNDLKKKNIRLWLYIFEFFADIFIYIMKRRLNIRYTLYPFLKFYELILVILHFFLSIFAAFFDSFLMPILEFIYTKIILKSYFSFRYYITLFLFIKKGPYYLNNVALLQMSTMLQKNGFVAPICKDKVKWYKAKLAYRAYRRKYLKAELTPDKVDNNALNIYIYLCDLVKDTRYQRKYIGIFDLLKVLYPYSIFVDLYFNFVYFFMGVIYVIYICLAPIWFILFLFYAAYLAYGIYYYIYCLLFKDIDFYLDLKRKETRNENLKKKFNENYIFFRDKIKKIYIFFCHILKKIKNLFK